MTASEFLQALATGSAIIDTDNVVVYSSGGEALKIPAKVVKAYLINGITPQFRNQGSGIEMSVDGGRLHQTKLVDSHCPFYDDIGHPVLFWFLNIGTFFIFTF